jgi:transposase
MREVEADLTFELRRIKKELARVTEERDILKNVACQELSADRQNT